MSNSFVVPARDALGSSLESATPVTMKVTNPKVRGERVAALDIKVGDRKGLRRGTYVFVLRYRTDLRARGMLETPTVRWCASRGTVRCSTTDSTTHAPPSSFPAAPSPPRALEDQVVQDGDDSSADMDDAEATLPATYLWELRRGSEHDELELLRTYAPEAESVPWVIRVDPRALEPLPKSAIVR